MEQPTKKQKTDHGIGFDGQLIQLHYKKQELETEEEKIETEIKRLKEAQKSTHRQKEALEINKLALVSDRWGNSWRLVIQTGKSGENYHNIVFAYGDEMIHETRVFCSKLALLKKEWQLRLVNALRFYRVVLPSNLGEEKTFYYLTRLCTLLAHIDKYQMPGNLDLIELSNDVCATLSLFDRITRKTDSKIYDLFNAKKFKKVKKTSSVSQFPHIPEMLILVGCVFPIEMQYQRWEQSSGCDWNIIREGVEFGDKNLLNFSFISNDKKRDACKALLALAEVKVNKMLIACEHRFGTDRENIWKRLPKDIMKLVVSYL